MTIGRKIKYIRNLYHMSSAELAELTGIHPVTIRKYETDKMIPQQAQINRIAAAFHLSSAVLTSVTDMQFNFSYEGDCLALLIMLYVSDGLFVTGERAPNGALIQETVRLELSPAFRRFLTLFKKDKQIDLEDLSIGIIDDNTLKSFMYWEYMYNRKDEYAKAYEMEQLEEKKGAYQQALDDYDEVEIRTLLTGRLGDMITQGALRTANKKGGSVI